MRSFRVWIDEWCGKLDLSNKVKSKVYDLIDKAGIRDVKPSWVASAIYIASSLMGERRTQAEISKVAGISEVTIRKKYKLMLNKVVM